MDPLASHAKIYIIYEKYNIWMRGLDDGKIFGKGVFLGVIIAFLKANSLNVFFV